MRIKNPFNENNLIPFLVFGISLGILHGNDDLFSFYCLVILGIGMKNKQISNTLSHDFK